MFLGSRGQVHKGLDLLLEVFAARPLLTLYVCSPFREESDFCRLYRRELWSTRNVRPIGFIDPTGRQFQEVASRCHYLVLPSCSEGQAGSVLTGMSGGLIPLVSRECGFDDTDVHLLPDCTLPGIAAAIDAYAAKPKAWLADESRRALERARQAHDESAYKASIRLALSRLGESPQVPVPARDVAERQ
jgi:glycosyltransferase involved in cell wall biosynthesis